MSKIYRPLTMLLLIRRTASLFFISLLISGCQQAQAPEAPPMDEHVTREPVVIDQTPEVEPGDIPRHSTDQEDSPFDEVPPHATDLEEPTFDVSAYQQWILPQDTLEWNRGNFLMDHDKELGRVDCVDLENGSTGGGDLLSTLIADPVARAMMNLSLYSPEYVRDLEKRLVEAVGDSFYASMVCHLGEGIDVIGGSIGGDVEFHAGDGTGLSLAVSRPNGVDIFHDIQLYNQTATGGEVNACTGELSGDEILWTCFMGFVFSEDDSIEYESSKTWIIYDNGDPVETIEDIVPL